MKMDEVVNKIVEHPFATTIIFGSVVNGIVKIIEAVKGIESKPNTVITIGKVTESKEDT